MSEEMRDALNVVRHFLEGDAGAWDWDDLLSLRPSDPEVRELQSFCRKLAYDFPPEATTDYCNANGMARLRDTLIYLESGGSLQARD